jgi:hypothetical protein
MKTLNTLILALGAVALLAATGLQAQTVTANIPFDFTVQSMTLPAGQYSLEPLSTSSHVIAIRNVESRKSIAVLTEPVSANPTEPGKLIFHCYNDRCFLSEVRTSNGPRGYLAPPKAEQELQASLGGQRTDSVVLLAAR